MNCIVELHELKNHLTLKCETEWIEYCDQETSGSLDFLSFWKQTDDGFHRDSNAVASYQKRNRSDKLFVLGGNFVFALDLGGFRFVLNSFRKSSCFF